MFLFHKTEFIIQKHLLIIHGTSVGIATGYGIEDREGFEFESLWGQGFWLHIIHTGYGVHSTAYPMGARGSFIGGKTTGVWSWPLTSK
jgi:hypothetical protein